MVLPEMENELTNTNSSISHENDVDQEMFENGGQQEEAASAANGNLSVHLEIPASLNSSENIMADENESNLIDEDELPPDFQEFANVEAQVAEENANNDENQFLKKKSMTIDKQEMFKKLQGILDRSGVFAELILGRLKKEEERETRKQAKKMKQKKKEDDEELKESRRYRLREKRKNDNVKYADYFDKKDLQSKRGRYQDEVALASMDEPDEGTSSANSASSSSTLMTNSTSAPKSLSIRQPDLFTGGHLRSYQLEGLKWMKAQYSYGMSGILGDEMGLGKTVQCIALICDLYDKGVTGPFLIIGPLSTLPNWIMEFERFAPEVPVVLYHGNMEQRLKIRKEIKKERSNSWNKRKILPVVLTSYEMVINDARFLSQFAWKHMIIDEAQRIKNFRCRMLKKLLAFQTESRLLLTGTPVQNNLAELWSLLNFLLPELFADLDWFESLFGIEGRSGTLQHTMNIADINNLAKQEEEYQMLTKLHRILAPFLLRRLKRDVELDLPNKKEIVVYAPMTPLQSDYYKASRDKTIVKLLRGDKNGWKILPNGVKLRSSLSKDETETDLRGPVRQNLNCVRMSMTLFRKITMHPYLLENPLDPLTNEYLIDENLVLKSGKMLVLDRLMPALKERGHKVLLFSTMTQMLDILMDYCELRDYKFCRLDGSMKLEDRQIEIKKFNEDPEHFIFMISTRAGGLGLNLMAADTVIIFDSDWNPQVDLQAQDRCHRIGQTKPVIIYRLVTRGTIDERIIERATAKRRLEKMVVYSGKFKQLTPQEYTDAAPPLTQEELANLLASTDYNECLEAKKDVISDEELERLLDRTDLNLSKIKDEPMA